MKKMIRSFIRKSVFRQILEDTYGTLLRVVKLWGLCNCSHSTSCEDIIIKRLLGDDNGWYVDIGANDPVFSSNTYLLHRAGLKGINVDPNPIMLERFEKYRPNAVNLCLGCDSEDGELTYWCFEEDRCNTMDEDNAKYIIEQNKNIRYEKKKVPVTTLEKIFDKHLPEGESISLLDIDAEGMELRILKGNDWNKYRPRLVSMECFTGYVDDINEIYKSPSVQYLVEQDYYIVAKLFNAVFFLDARKKYSDIK